jgi:Spy/CpxP family protein refolding chaperone
MKIYLDNCCLKGFEALNHSLGLVEMEKFIALIQREPFDYTEWRKKGLETDLSIEEISEKAMEFQKKIEQKD